MSVALRVFRGYGNGTVAGTVNDRVHRGYTAGGAVVTAVDVKYIGFMADAGRLMMGIIMATLWVTEFARAASGDYGGGIQAPLYPELANNNVTIGASSVQSKLFNNETRLIRLHTDTACYISIGTNPTANTSKTRMIADSTEFVGIPAGRELKIAVIAE